MVQYLSLVNLKQYFLALCGFLWYFVIFVLWFFVVRVQPLYFYFLWYVLYLLCSLSVDGNRFVIKDNHISVCSQLTDKGRGSRQGGNQQIKERKKRTQKSQVQEGRGVQIESRTDRKTDGGEEALLVVRQGRELCNLILSRTGVTRPDLSVHHYHCFFSHPVASVFGPVHI